jgi:hypothetical protein
MIFWWRYVLKVDSVPAIYHISWIISFVQMFLDVLQLYVFKRLCYFEFMFQKVFHVNYAWCLRYICFDSNILLALEFYFKFWTSIISGSPNQLMYLEAIWEGIIVVLKIVYSIHLKFIAH